MRILISISLICFQALIAQVNWTYQYTRPTVNPLYAVHFPVPDTGYIAGDTGTILKSVDGGDHWSILSSGTSVNLQVVQFLTSDLGYAGGYDGEIIKTTDGGITWDQQDTPIADIVFDLFFLAPDTGYAVGRFSEVLYTEDGGNTWEILTSLNYGTHFKAIHFVSKEVGFVIENHGYIYKTTNGGQSWSLYDNFPPNLILLLWSIDFYDELNGIIGCTNGMYLLTSDSGESWTIYYLPIAGDYFVTAQFTSIDTVYMIGNNAAYINSHFIKSFDGGYTWYSYHFLSDQFGDMYFKDNNSGVLVGTGSRIFYTSDTGDNWQPRSFMESKSLLGIGFANENRGFAVGIQGYALRTYNGSIWNEFNITGNTGRHKQSVSFGTEGIGLIASYEGIFRTADYGGSWQVVTMPDAIGYFYDVEFASNSIAYVVGRRGRIFKSNDAGFTWVACNFPYTSSSADLYDVHFINENYGFIGSFRGIFKTGDGGNSWTNVHYTIQDITSIDFPSPSSGYAAGEGGLILKTEDGGDTWYEQQHNLTDEDLNSIKFLDNSQGIAVGDAGTLLYTIDGGDNWEQEAQFTWRNFKAIALVPDRGWYLCGDNGMILFSDNCGGLLSIEDTWVYNSSMPVGLFINNIYPNPFNSSATIEYTVPFQGLINVVVYDMLGREVTWLVDENVSAGRHQILWNSNHVASGTYIITINNQDSFKSKKVTIIK